MTNATKSEFELLAEGVPIRRTYQKGHLAPVIRADVARIGSRLVARIAPVGQLKGPPWGCTDLPSEDLLPNDVDHDIDLTNGAIMPRHWGQEIENALRGAPDDYRRLGPGPESEPSRFAREWPEIALQLGIAAPAPRRRLFAPGPAWFHAGHKRRKHPIAEGLLRGFVDRHCDGDFGEYGTHGDVSLSPAQLHELARLPVETQNRYALLTHETGSAVRSRFRLEDPRLLAAIAEGRHPWQPILTYYIDVVTPLVPSPATVLSLEGLPS